MDHSPVGGLTYSFEGSTNWSWWAIKLQSKDKNISKEDMKLRVGYC